ncbi:MAG: hypothetical protein HYU79_01670 [Nitrosomonadales bacterium]|nr:hypothetical protein [Nitrosomonadales bacterium]
MKKIADNPFWLRVAPILLFALLGGTPAQAAKPFDLDGFKDIKLGSSTSEMAAKGFKCVDDYHSCQLKDGVENKRTLFGQPTRIGANYTDNVIDDIDVTIDITDDEMIKQFTSALGEPMTHDYVSFAGYKIRQFIWVSTDKASIVVTKNLDKSHEKNIFGQIVPINFSSANYLSTKKTSDLLEEVKKGKLDKSDF